MDHRTTPVSFGVAEALSNEDGGMLVARADKALDAAKQGGRNCVYRHVGETADRVVGNRECAVQEPQGQPPSGPLPCEYETVGQYAPGCFALLLPTPDLPMRSALSSVFGRSFYRTIAATRSSRPRRFIFL